MALVAAITTFWVALGTWVGLFPGTLESLLNVSYDFHGTWGTDRATYEWLTLGTLGVVIATAVIGYLVGGKVRRDQVVVPIKN